MRGALVLGVGWERIRRISRAYGMQAAETLNSGNPTPFFLRCL